MIIGSDLIQHHESFHQSREEKIKQAGYIIDGKVKYTLYYENLQTAYRWKRAQENITNCGGTKVIRAIVDAVIKKVNYRGGNDEVIFYHNLNVVRVYFYGELICSVDFLHNRVIIEQDVNQTKSTKERLNRILMATTGCQLFQKTRQWYIYSPLEDKDFKFPETYFVPFIKHCSNQALIRNPNQ